MIIAITGESCSGKTTVAELLSTMTEIPIIRLYTTRPRREGEPSDAYMFVSEEAFTELVESGKIAASDCYRGWWYGVPNIPTDCNRIGVFTPSIVRRLKRERGDVASAWISVDRRSRLMKLLERGDDIEEAYRRNLSEVGQFDGWASEADMIFTNPAYRYTAKQLASGIKDVLSFKYDI